MDKRASLTSRTLEKLGLNSFRLRSNSQPTPPTQSTNTEQDHSDLRTHSNTIDSKSDQGSNDVSQNQEHKKTLKAKLWNYYHRNEGKQNKKDRKKKLSLDETRRFGKDDEKKPTSVFYVDPSQNIMVTTEKGGDKNANEERKISEAGHEKKKKTAPVGTTEYTVKDRETIESIAAHFDTTPSELKKVNRLISSMIFAGQVIYIPDKNYVPTSVARSVSPAEPMDIVKKSPVVSPVGSPRPTMDVPLVKAANRPPDVIPGHAERSPTEEAEFEIVPPVPPTKLSEDEVQQLDQDCMERFIKLKVKHITDGQGVVKGTLLVTPNAVMFDPDVLDPLVEEHGSEKYGMIAPMDMIISAAMYHDIAVMKLRGKVQPDGTMFPKPEVYHDKTCPLFIARQNSKEKEIDDSEDRVGDLTDVAEAKRKTYSKTKSESVCSCGGGIDLKDKDSLFTFDSDKIPESENLSGEVNLGRNADSAEDAEMKLGGEISASLEDNLIDFGDSEVKPTECDKFSKTAEFSEPSEHSLKPTHSPRSPKSPRSPRSPRSHVTFSIDEVSEAVTTVSDKTITVSDKTITVSDKTISDTLGRAEAVKEPFTASALSKVSAVGDIEDKDKEALEDEEKTQIGNIVYLPVREDSEGHVTLKSLEETQNALSKLSTEAFEQTSKSDTNLTGTEPMKSENQDIEKKRSASTSSLGPFSPSPHLSAFVNYATGFFSRTESQKDIKDIKDVVPEYKTEELKKTSDIPVIAAAPMAGKRRGKISRHSNTNQEIAVESAVKMTEKLEDLFSVDYDKFKPRKSIAYSDPPLYLCLRLGMPTNKVFHNYSIESYGRRRKKSEYWFSIPRDKVDHLYAFFVQWTPEIYGDQEDIDPEKRGFVVIPDNQDDDEDSLEVLDEYFGQNSCLYKDWEIISKIEAIKRRSIVLDEPLPLPDLVGQSTILDDSHILQLSQVIPPRTVGYPWSLIYSTDKHGFSLKTLYRDMQGLDSPILLVVKDTHDNVFGALTSCELKISDHFYGTGETFLFTFFPEFQVFNWSGDNNFFMKGHKESLSIGAGQGVFGLWFDGDLYHGRTHKCDTFNNELLTSSEDFVVKAFEAWAFVQD